ncbi:MAG TPA: putative metal-dependent hydrolase [Candidatus Angelobacter sp.]|nr:putative metal-dependent hydrolase [Candidatus Angelobacter sp.]
MSDPRYPIGRFTPDQNSTPESRERHIEQIAALPAKMRSALRDLKPDQLETPYREGGWTLKQVAHHVPDSHLNAYVRFKLALTENVPTIKPYDEAAWARLKDAEVTSIEVSLSLLEALHIRWVNLLRGMKAEDFNRKVNHPESGAQTLDRMLALYDWHGNHHLAHITTTRERMKW